MPGAKHWIGLHGIWGRVFWNTGGVCARMTKATARNLSGFCAVAWMYVCHYPVSTYTRCAACNA